MLDHRLSPAQRALWLLPDPITYTLPTKDMPALRHTRVLQSLETQRAFPILPFDVPYRLLVISQVESGARQNLGMRPFADLLIRARDRRFEKEFLIGTVGIGVKRDLDAAT